MAELRAAITDLESVMTERFTETFARVDAAFQETFVDLFGGGSAQLILTRPDSPLETGVDVIARPPGKRLQGLMSLSGGERALTSVALLFALLRVNPTPFVLLDEVDAALDESNVQRFADMVRTYAQHSQFVVVTHNRATMEIGDALFGVSMEAGGVSKVLSLRLSAA
jgi:chromosome segregation protein